MPRRAPPARSEATFFTKTRGDDDDIYDIEDSGQPQATNPSSPEYYETLKDTIHLASKNGDKETLQKTINDLKHQERLVHKAQQNKDIKIDRKKFGETPLHISCEKGNEEIVKLLLEKNSKINALDSLRETPLHKASRENHIGTALILLKDENIKINLQNSSNETALHIACENNFENLAQSLIVNKADIAIKDEENRTALHLACKAGSTRIVKLLLDRGANIDELGGKLNQTPLHIAVENGHLDIAELLLNAGANIDAKNKLGFTPLYNAVRTKELGMIKLLLDRGADIEIKDLSGKSALDLVEKNLKSENPDPELQKIKQLFDERQKFEASLILKTLSEDSLKITSKSSGELSSTLRALSIDRLMSLHIHDKSFGVD